MAGVGVSWWARHLEGILTYVTKSVCPSPSRFTGWCTEHSKWKCLVRSYKAEPDQVTNLLGNCQTKQPQLSALTSPVPDPGSCSTDAGRLCIILTLGSTSPERPLSPVAARSGGAGFWVPWFHIWAPWLCFLLETTPSLRSPLARRLHIRRHHTVLPIVLALNLAVFSVALSTRLYMPGSSVGGEEGKWRIEYILICRRDGKLGKQQNVYLQICIWCHPVAVDGTLYWVYAGCVTQQLQVRAPHAVLEIGRSLPSPMESRLMLL